MIFSGYSRLKVIRRWGDDAAPDPRVNAFAASRKVNLNRAAATTIEKLPGIGPKTASAIIAARPLKDLAALDAVRGIGQKAIETLRDLVDF